MLSWKKVPPKQYYFFPLYSTKWLGQVPTRRFDGGVGVGGGGCGGWGGCGGSGGGDSCGGGDGGDVGGDGDGRVLVVA